MQVPVAAEVVHKDLDPCSLPDLIQLAAKMRQQPAGLFLEHIIKYWVVLRHFRVVAERSEPNDGKNRFRFLIGEAGLQRFDASLAPSRPALAQDRLQHILILLRQSGLLMEQTHDGEPAYRLSARGRERTAELPH
jgi:hypothetical protein